MTMKLISSKSNLFILLPRGPAPSYCPISPSFLPPLILHSLLLVSLSCVFSFNANPQRPDCAYNPPWLDKPPISRVSTFPKDPGFEFLFLTSLFEVQDSSQWRSQTQSSHMVTFPTELCQAEGIKSRGIDHREQSSVHVETGEEV